MLIDGLGHICVRCRCCLDIEERIHCVFEVRILFFIIGGFEESIYSIAPLNSYIVQKTSSIKLCRYIIIISIMIILYFRISVSVL